MVAMSPQRATSSLGSGAHRPGTGVSTPGRHERSIAVPATPMLLFMGRSRRSTSPVARLMAATAMVVAALGIGWCFEPSGIRADQDRGRSIIVREPAISIRADAAPDGSPTSPASDAPATHAIVVDSDLDLDLDFATGPRP